MTIFSLAVSPFVIFVLLALVLLGVVLRRRARIAEARHSRRDRYNWPVGGDVPGDADPDALEDDRSR